MKYLICAILILTLLAANLAGAATKYVMKDLGRLPGCDQAAVEAIDNKGRIVGKCWKTADSADPLLAVCRAFLWENGKLTEVKAPVGDKGVCRMDINDSGVMMVAGWVDSFVIEKDVPTKIPPLPGKKGIRGLAINNRGDVLANGSEGKGMQPVFYRAGASKPIDVPAGYTRVDSCAMNNKGQVAITLQTADRKYATALWEDGKFSFLSGIPAGLEVCALADDGAIAGIYDTSEDLVGCVWRNGSVTRLKMPTALFSPWPSCINKSGEVAGLCMSEDAGTYAVVWDRNGVPTELTPPDLYECEVVDINDAGVVVGMVYDDDGRSRAVVWTPVK